MELDTVLEWKDLIPSAGTITKTPSTKYIITNGVTGGGTGPTDQKPPKPVPTPTTPTPGTETGGWGPTPGSSDFA